LAVNIAHHVFVESAGPVIIEGDGILPALAARRDFSNMHFTPAPVTNEVRAVFLVEPDEEVVIQNMRQRGRGFGQLSLKEQETFARASWLYGQWLRRQADRYELPIVEARPHETLVERVLQAIGECSLNRSCQVAARPLYCDTSRRRVVTVAQSAELWIVA